MMNLRNMFGQDLIVDGKRIPKEDIKPGIYYDRQYLKTFEVGEDLMEIPFYREKFQEIRDLPPVTDGVVLIVPTHIRDACPKRKDIVSPIGFSQGVSRGNGAEVKALCYGAAMFDYYSQMSVEELMDQLQNPEVVNDPEAEALVRDEITRRAKR